MFHLEFVLIAGNVIVSPRLKSKRVSNDQCIDIKFPTTFLSFQQNIRGCVRTHAILLISPDNKRRPPTTELRAQISRLQLGFQKWDDNGFEFFIIISRKISLPSLNIIIVISTILWFVEHNLKNSMSKHFAPGPQPSQRSAVNPLHPVCSSSAAVWERGNTPGHWWSPTSVCVCVCVHLNRGWWHENLGWISE